MTCRPLNVEIPSIRLTRAEDAYHIGNIHVEDSGFRATRKAQPAPEEQVFTCFEDARHWIRTSPHVPDLDRFPYHKGIYGPVLVDLPNMQVVGYIARAPQDHYNSVWELGKSWQAADLLLLTGRQQISGYVRPGADWTLAVHQGSEDTIKTYIRQNDADMLTTLVQLIVRTFHAAFSAHERMEMIRMVTEGVEAEVVPFLRDKVELRAQFKAGRGAT